MNTKSRCISVLLRLSVCAIIVGLAFVSVTWAQTATPRPILVSQPTSTRALAFESVTQKSEPFMPNASVRFGDDQQTRIVLFALNLNLQPGDTTAAVTADAQDGDGHIYNLSVEFVGKLPNYEWATAVIVRVPENLGDAGDVLMRVTYRDQPSNRVRVGIGHTGGGPEDDFAAVPTPGTIAPQFPGNPVTAGNLTADDVRTLIAQAVSAAVALNAPAVVAVTDKEGNVLGLFRMTGAPSNIVIRGPGTPQPRDPITGLVPVGLENARLPAHLAAISKAGTPALFSTQGNAFNTRTASFIIQEHFPPGIDNQGAGPLYGVQFSSLPCSDIKRQPFLGGFGSTLPLGLSGDPGSMPIYKNGQHAGGIGIEVDGIYGLDRDPRDFDQPVEEIIAFSAVRGYDPPAAIRGDTILVNGIRLPFTNLDQPIAPAQIAFAALPGQIDPQFPVRGAQPSQFATATVAGINGGVDPRFFPFIGSPSSGGLTAAEVNQIISGSARQAIITRAAIRQPLGSAAAVSISVVDVEGRVLGIFRTPDAPVFGFDVAVQKARGAVFASRADAGATLRANGFGSYVDRAQADGIMLDGSIAFSDRAIGFNHRPFFPDGINDSQAGAFSAKIPEWSPFNVGLQLDLIRDNLVASILGADVRCSNISKIPNGIQIFPGSIPLYKGNTLVGAVGISGDGVDQDDIIAAGGAAGFLPPANIRSDSKFVRGVRLPFVKFPRSPNL